MPYHTARGRIEPLPVLDGVALDEIPDRQERREGVGELHDGESRHDGDQPEEVRDGGGDDERRGPVDRHEDGPEVFALLGVEGRRVEDVHQDVVVQHFEADVAEEAGCDGSTEDGERVPGGLQCVARDALVGDLVGISAVHRGSCQPDLEFSCDGSWKGRTKDVLALEIVHVTTVYKIACIDEELSRPHRLQEIPRSPHLRHELHKQMCTAVGVYRLHEAVDTPN